MGISQLGEQLHRVAKERVCITDSEITDVVHILVTVIDEITCFIVFNLYITKLIALVNIS